MRQKGLALWTMIRLQRMGEGYFFLAGQRGMEQDDMLRESIEFDFENGRELYLSGKIAGSFGVTLILSFRKVYIVP